jgi:DNA adenine methylase
VSIYQQEINPDRNVHINDIYWDLYNLWVQVRDNCSELVSNCLQIRKEYDKSDPSRGKVLFDDMTNLYTLGDDIAKATSFFVKNKISFSGVGGVSNLAYRDTFNDGNTKKLLEIGRIIKNFTITNSDYRELFAIAQPDDFFFLDPPYDIKDMLYGPDGQIHAGFNHREFFEAVDKLPCKWLITYNDNETLRDWYKDYFIKDESYNYCMSFETDEDGNKKQRTKNELIITNYEVN